MQNGKKLFWHLAVLENGAITFLFRGHRVIQLRGEYVLHDISSTFLSTYLIGVLIDLAL